MNRNDSDPQVYKSMRLTVRTIFAIAACLAAWASALPAEFSVLLQDQQRSVELTVVRAENADYLDLGELTAALGGRLTWETVGERIEWELDGLSFVFDDLLGFFSAGAGQYQLYAPCRLDAGRFLVPSQVAVEYLPKLLPQRFTYNKIVGRLVDRGASVQPPAASLTAPVRA
ncbi:MAG TPA: hypothetical protein VJ417_13605, partial [Candidatus Glassbacteria bacterium]|nr:hypothetical protein [Candidatus Glassbacteria bacterium]